MHDYLARETREREKQGCSSRSSREGASSIREKRAVIATQDIRS